MHERTKKLQFDAKARQAIADRDGWCIFCQIGYKMPKEPCQTTDIMHIVGRAQGGLGIEQNGVLGCRHHHMMMDNGNGGDREAMQEYIEKYMKRFYPDWSREALYYRKGETDE